LKEEKLFRKIQLTGGSTLIVSLPKSWVESVGVKAGSYVTLIPQFDGSLLIKPRETGIGETSEIVISATPDMTPSTVVREFIACYVSGYDFIRVKFKPGTSEHKVSLKKNLREKLIGVELISESIDELLAQCLVGYKEIPLDVALNRMSIITVSMINDAIGALKTLNRELALEVSVRDNEVDRLYFFMVRQLKRAVRDRTILNEIGIRGPRYCLGYRMIIKTVERTADHASRIACLIPLMGKAPSQKIFDEILSIKEVAIKALKSSIGLLSKFDLKKANQIIDRVEDARLIEQNAIRKMLDEASKTGVDVINLRLIVESLRRIVEYGADIAEIAINLSVGEP